MKQVMKYAALVVVLGLLVPTLAWALGGDYGGNHKLPAQEHWPKGLEPLVNAENRVHGYFVNAIDFFYFTGGTDTLNTFLGACGKFEDTHMTLVLHPGGLEARSPWDKEPAQKQADWQIMVGPTSWLKLDQRRKINYTEKITLQIDIYLGTEIDLAKLNVPASIEVRSGGEIEAFVQQHEKLRKLALPHPLLTE